MWNGVDMKKTAGLDTIPLNGALVIVNLVLIITTAYFFCKMNEALI